MRFRLPTGILICLAGAAFAAGLEDERVWSGVNGKTFRGTFHRVQPDGGNVEFSTPQGKLVVVAMANLIPADQKLIQDRDKKSAPEAPAVGDAGAFKPEVAPERALMPRLDPKNFSTGSRPPMVDAMWVSFLWWDQAGVLEVPRKGSFEWRAEWLYKELSRKFTSSDIGEAQKGVEKYFEENLKDVAACRMVIHKNDLSLARLSVLCRGSNAVILQMTGLPHSNGPAFPACAALESIGADGKFAFHAFGRRFSGTAKPAPENNDTVEGRNRWFEFVLDNRQDLPAIHLQKDARFFFFGQGSWHQALVIKPYVYLTPGKPSPLPPEDLVPAPDKPEPIVE